MKLENLSSNRVKFTFNVTKEEFKEALDYAFEQVKENVEVKGFRKGHVTRSVYENKFGVESLFEEGLNYVLHHKYMLAVQDQTHELVGNPTPIVDFEKVNVDGDFEISLEFAVKPEFEIANYKGLEVKSLSVEATDEEVDSQIEQLMQGNVTLELKEEGSLENGDTAIFDFEGFESGEPFEGGKAENFELEIGSGQFIPGFEEQMVGMNAGEEKEVNVTFPEQYHSEDLAGKDAVFNVKLHEIKVKVKPELNDEWVLTLERDAKTVDALKEEIKANIIKGKENQNKNIQLDDALTQLAEATNIELPQEMIDFEVDNQLKQMEQQAGQYGMDLQTYISLTGMTEEALREQMAGDAEKRVVNSLLIEAVAKAENFEVSSEDLEEKYQEIAAMYQMEVEEVKKHIKDDVLTKDVEFSKAIDFIYDNLTFID